MEGIIEYTVNHIQNFLRLSTCSVAQLLTRIPLSFSCQTAASVVGLRETSASDIGVTGGEETSLLSLLCLASNNLFTVIIGVR